MSASLSVLSSSRSSSVYNQSSSSSASSSSARAELFAGRRGQQQPIQQTSEMYAKIKRLLEENERLLKDLTLSLEGQTKTIEAQEKQIAANETMLGRLREEYARVDENNQGIRRAVDVQHQENEQVHQDLQEVRADNRNLKTAIALESLVIGGVALATPAVSAVVAVGSYAVAGAKKVVEVVKS